MNPKSNRSLPNRKQSRTWAIAAALAVCLIVMVACAANPAENGQDLSFLNYKNAISLIGQNGTQAAVIYGQESITPGYANDTLLIRFLEDVNWKQCRAPAQIPPSLDSVVFVIEADYRITVWGNRLACVRDHGAERWYRTGKDDFSTALTLVTRLQRNTPMEAALAESWVIWRAMSASQQGLSAVLPGNIYREFETWEDACAFAGATPWNPLEESAGAVNMNWAGTDYVSLGRDSIQHTYVSAKGSEEGGVDVASIRAGYALSGARVELTALLAGEFGEYDNTSPVRYTLSDGSIVFLVRKSGKKYTMAELYFLRISDGYRYKVQVTADTEDALNAALNQTLSILGMVNLN